MRKIIKPDFNNFIIAEGSDYLNTGKTSIWGEGDPDTIKYLNGVTLKGKWLNVAAGDGRYNNLLLKKADKVVAGDIDPNALEKLKRNTPQDLQFKLSLIVFDITKLFPFESGVFDGIFCVGTLHLFPPVLLKSIFSEFNRVLKPKGTIIIDFATDIERTFPNGSKKVEPKNRPKYQLDEAIKLVGSYFRSYQKKFIKSSVVEDRTQIKTDVANFGYIFRCNYFLMEAKNLNPVSK